MLNRSLVSITDFNREEYLKVLSVAADFELNSYQNLLQGKVIATLFFEPSTRTRLSFESAINRLGGKVIGFSDSQTTSVTKGETLNDTIRVISNYAELIVMRHTLEGSARYASEISRVPIVNAGDGANQHPTQTLLDLYSIQKTQGTLENLKIFMVGDLKYGRTVHSLLMALSEFNTTFYFIAPDELKMPVEYKLHLEKKGLKYYESKELEGSLGEADIIYMTRVQKERFSDPIEYERTKNAYVLKDSMLCGTKDTLRVLHPLPRVNEIHPDVDANPKAYYFQQTENGVYIRQAIISLILGLK
ncbi:MAG: aspartate carbamoyltransferase [Bacteroidales bacterium]|nr:aspartate carbamoyltransferase [Bacteroidales bacterium]